MIKNKSLFKNISLFLCLVPMFVLSIFCLIPNKVDHSVSAADVVITNFNFVGSKVIIPMTKENLSSGAFESQNVTCLTLSFGVLDGVYRASVYGYADTNMSSSLAISGVNDNVSNAEQIVSRTNFLNVGSSGSNYGFRIIVFHSGQLSSNIIKVRYSSYENLTPNTFKPANFYNTITYYDDQGEFIEFQFPLKSNNQTFASSFLFDERFYYFTSSFSDNDYYNEGYNAGIEEGYNQGEDVGYQNGYRVGENVGYGNGYNDGLEFGGQYSFKGLLSAVIDVPVNAFKSLLNFDILGVNILSLLTGLLSVAIIVFIVKLCTGGK